MSLLLPERCQRCDLPCEPQLRGRGRPSKQNKAVAAQREKEKAGIAGAESHDTSWNPINHAINLLCGLKSVALQNLGISRVLATAAAFRIGELEKTEPTVFASQIQARGGKLLLPLFGLVGCDAETLRRQSRHLLALRMCGRCVARVLIRLLCCCWCELVYCASITGVLSLVVWGW